MTTVLIAQLTDTHVLNPESNQERWVDNNDRLAQAVESLNAEDPRPDLVLATGDLTNNAEPGEIDALRALLAPLDLPLLALPGNHDDRSEIRNAFDQPWPEGDHLSWTADLGPLRLIGLDTTVPREHHGDFDADREAWLRGALGEAGERPTVIAMHHPPFASGIGWMDHSMLRRADAFAAVVADFPSLTRIFCGHLHRPVQTSIAGIPTSVGLATVHHVGLDLSPDAPVEIIRDPAGYQLHRFDGAAWLSHTRYIDTGEQPFTPSWAK